MLSPWHPKHFFNGLLGWSDSPDRGLGLANVREMSAGTFDAKIGFRCAKSARPK
ncbi:MAG: hypothetical protein GY711_09780 [bacterium]|nr:hypothetical protein [bacterium]